MEHHLVLGSLLDEAGKDGVEKLLIPALMEHERLRVRLPPSWLPSCVATADEMRPALPLQGVAMLIVSKNPHIVEHIEAGLAAVERGSWQVAVQELAEAIRLIAYEF